MVGIYDESFIDLLKEHFKFVKVKSKNIIIPCPWCEYGEKKDHYHLYISLVNPIFHCFHGDCQKSGTIKKLVLKLTGTDVVDKYVDKKKIEENNKSLKIINSYIKKEKIELKTPNIDESYNNMKTLYLKNRFGFANIDFKNINGLILNVEKFFELNKKFINEDESLMNLKYYLFSNFIGFLSEHKTMAVFRNIDSTSDFKHFKLYFQNSNFLDYYKIEGNNEKSNKIILSEGIFDILSEHIFDFTNLKQSSRLYAAGLSTSYESLIKSLVFNEQIFKPDIFILSDRDIKLEYYKKIKKKIDYLINSMTVFYNTMGKDFAESPVNTVKFIL